MGKRVAATETASPLISNRMYDFFKWLVQYVLPGAGTLYFTLAQVWGLPYAEQVLGTTSALAIFFGLIMGISNKSYNASEAKYDGALVVDDSDPEKDVYSFEVTTPLEELAGKTELTIKVQKPA